MSSPHLFSRREIQEDSEEHLDGSQLGFMALSKSVFQLSRCLSEPLLLSLGGLRWAISSNQRSTCRLDSASKGHSWGFLILT